MSNRVARVAVTSTPGRGRHVILETGQTSVNTGPPVIDGVTALQVLGAFSGTVDVDAAAGDALTAQDLSFICALSPGLPNSFSLTSGSSGYILATAALVALPDDPVLAVSAPAISLSFGTGLPTDAGSGTWSLRSGIAYQGPVLNATVRCLSIAATAAVTLTFVVQATLIGVPTP